MGLIEKNEFKPKLKTLSTINKFDSKMEVKPKEMKHYELMKLVLDGQVTLNAKK